MSYQISVDSSNTYIVCRVHTPVSAELAMRFSAEIDQLGISNDINRYLIDVRDVENIETVNRNYEFVNKDMKDLKLRRNVRVGILVSPKDHTHNFIEVMCRNAGYNVKLFRQEEKAIAWMIED